MRKILMGLLFIFIDINIGNIDIIPDFIGYFIIANGLSEMVLRSSRFAKAGKLSVFMIFYSLIIFLLEIAAGEGMDAFISIILSLISTLLFLGILFNIIMGLKDIEDQNKVDLTSRKLCSLWSAIAIIMPLTYLSIYFSPLAIPLIVIGFVLYVIFLISFNHAKNLYDSMAF